MNTIDLVCNESLDAFPAAHSPNTEPPSPTPPNLPPHKIHLTAPAVSSPITCSSASPHPSTTSSQLSTPHPVPLPHPVAPLSPVYPHPADHSSVLADLAVRDLAYVVPRTTHSGNTLVTSALRCEVVSWFADLVADLAMPDAAVAVATNIYDRFMATFPVDPILIFATSSACFLITCKVVLDEEVSNDEVAERTRVSLQHLNRMEALILTHLGWAVNVVSPHEVLAEVQHLIEVEDDEVANLRELQKTLVMAAMVDAEFMHLRASAVGIACHVLSAVVMTDVPVDEFERLPGYVMARLCGVPMAEVDFCLTRLRNTLATLLGFVEDCDTDVSMDESTGEREEEEEAATAMFVAAMQVDAV